MTVPNINNPYLAGTIQISSTLEITGITQTNPMVVTCTVDATTASNTYISGQLVKLFIPFLYGMQQANGNTYKILSISGLDFSLDVNSTNFDAFSVPSSGIKPASMSPSGSNNLSYSNLTDQVAFQSLNNTGN